jgi:hypothetical protein
MKQTKAQKQLQEKIVNFFMQNADNILPRYTFHTANSTL